MITLNPEEDTHWASIKAQQNQLQDNTFMNNAERELYQQKLDQFNLEHKQINPQNYISEIPTLDYIDKNTFQKKN